MTDQRLEEYLQNGYVIHPGLLASSVAAPACINWRRSSLTLISWPYPQYPCLRPNCLPRPNSEIIRSQGGFRSPQMSIVHFNLMIDH